MKRHSVNKACQQTNEKIKSGEVVVVYVEEIIGIIKVKGPLDSTKCVDAATTDTFAPVW